MPKHPKENVNFLKRKWAFKEKNIPDEKYGLPRRSQKQEPGCRKKLGGFSDRSVLINALNKTFRGKKKKKKQPSGRFSFLSHKPLGGGDCPPVGGEAETRAHYNAETLGGGGERR